MNNNIDSAVFCLGLIAKYHDHAIDTQTLHHQLSGLEAGCERHDLARIAKQLGFKSRLLTVTEKRIHKAAFPFIARSGSGQYFIVAAYDNEKNQCLVQFAGQNSVSVEASELFEVWEGDALWITTRFQLNLTVKKFGIRWFIPVIVKYRRVLGEVVLASFFLQLFAVVTPVCFQVVMDTVLVHQTHSTLNIIAISLLAITLFDVALSTLRSYLFSHTSCRVDVELGTRLFQHLLNIPIAYFNTRPGWAGRGTGAGAGNYPGVSDQ